jgi:hypothetical protein
MTINLKNEDLAIVVSIENYGVLSQIQYMHSRIWCLELYHLSNLKRESHILFLK